MDVFAIERSDKRLVQCGDDAMCHLIPAMLDLLQLVESRLHIGRVLENVVQQTCALSEIL